MQDPQKLQEENERLIVELAAYKEAEKTRKQKKGSFIKRLSSFGSWFFLGGDFKASIKKLVVEVRDKDKQLSNDTLGDVLAHGAWRFTRIGCFAVTMAFIPLAILSVQTTLLYYQNQKIDTQNELFTAQNRRLDQQTHLQEAERRSSLVFLFSNIMDAIDQELREDYNFDSIRNLSPQLVGRIISISLRLQPYKHLTNDSLTNNELSPERGQLLVNLLECQLDSLTYNSIFEKAYFSSSDLKNTFLAKMHLEGIYLFNSNMEETNLQKANLQKAHLGNINLQKAYLNEANLRSSYLKGANLRGAYLEYANLEKVNLVDVNLHDAYLRGVNLDNARTNALDFIQKIEQWNVDGIKEIKQKYYVDTLPRFTRNDKEKKEPYYLIKEKQ